MDKLNKAINLMSSQYGIDKAYCQDQLCHFVEDESLYNTAQDIVNDYIKIYGVA